MSLLQLYNQKKNIDNCYLHILLQLYIYICEVYYSYIYTTLSRVTFTDL